MRLVPALAVVLALLVGPFAYPPSDGSAMMDGGPSAHPPGRGLTEVDGGSSTRPGTGTEGSAVPSVPGGGAEKGTLGASRVATALGAPRVPTALDAPAGGFTENAGQLDENAVRYYTPGGGLWFTDDGLWMELPGEKPEAGPGSGDGQQTSPPGPGTIDSERAGADHMSVVLRHEVVDPNPVGPKGEARLGWDSNFFTGSNPAGWRTSVPNFGEVWYRGVRDGVDLRYHPAAGGLKYDIIVNPGADPGDIRLRYTGAEGLVISPGGSLLVDTAVGSFEDGGLLIYQDLDDGRRNVEGRLVLLGGLDYGFRVTGTYDRDRPLVIDPEFRYSTFFGGGATDGAYDIAADPKGNTYVTGWTRSVTFPVTTGVMNETHNGETDVFLLKLNSDGSSLHYSSFLGGASHDYGTSVAIDHDGNATIVGYTLSSNFPTTEGAYSLSKNPEEDIFVCKVNPQGTGVHYSTMVGGENTDVAHGVALDPLGKAVVVGETDSPDFPVTPGSYDTTFAGGMNGFALKVSIDGGSLGFSTHIDDGVAYGVVTDKSGKIFIAGMAGGSFATTVGAYDNTYQGGSDAYVLKLAPNGNSATYATYIGGNGLDYATGIDVTNKGEAYVAGYTESSDLPTTPGANNSDLQGPSDAFVANLDSDGASLKFSTYLGGNFRDGAHDVGVDSAGNVFVTGYTESATLYTTEGALDETYSGGKDAFFCEYDPIGSSFKISTYVGGGEDEQGYGLAVDAGNDVYVCGYTVSPEFPTTPGAYDTAMQGFLHPDAFAFKYSFENHMNITAFEFLFDDKPAKKIYTRLGTYHLRLNVSDTANIADVDNVLVRLDPGGSDIRLRWDGSSGKFRELYDPDDVVTLEPSSNAVNNQFDNWTLEFHLSFNWTFPGDVIDDIRVTAEGIRAPTAYLNDSVSRAVVSGLEFAGGLAVSDTGGEPVQDGMILRGGTRLDWTGVYPVYAGTDNVFPPEREFNVTLWDGSGEVWEDSPDPGQAVFIESRLPWESDLDGNVHTLNISGVPTESDLTDMQFTIRVDGDGVVFTEPSPSNSTWQTLRNVRAGMTITDVGGGQVDGNGILVTTSHDNGTFWEEWTSVRLATDTTVRAVFQVLLNEGTENLVKWQAFDTLGNGPEESPPQRVLVDTEGVTFENPFPSEFATFHSTGVRVGIDIMDATSGVNGSSIQYAISKDDGMMWSEWVSVPGMDDGDVIHVEQDLTFANGSGNLVKWRASDVAGNPPRESSTYRINIDTWVGENLKAYLVAPRDGLIAPTASVKLVWAPRNPTMRDIVYDVILDTVNPPVDVYAEGIPDRAIEVKGLENGRDYYWTVIPRTESEVGECTSGIWTFKYDRDAEVPEVALVHPYNGAVVAETSVTLSWAPVGSGADWRYDVFTGASDPPTLLQASDLLSTRSILDGLEDGRTYYWTVVAISLDGIPSPFGETVWSFTVDLSAPTSDYSLTLGEVDDLKVEAGKAAELSLVITNTGTDFDTFHIYVDLSSLSITGMACVESTVAMAVQETKVVSLEWYVPRDTVLGEYAIVVRASSIEAQKLGLDVSEATYFTLEVVAKGALGEETAGGGEEETSDQMFMFLVVMVVMAVVIALLAVVLARKRGMARKKKGKKGDSALEEWQRAKKEEEARKKATEDEEAFPKPTPTPGLKTIPGPKPGPGPTTSAPGPKPLGLSAGPKPMGLKPGPKPMAVKPGPKPMGPGAGPKPLGLSAGPKPMGPGAGPKHLGLSAGPKPMGSKPGPKPMAVKPGPKPTKPTPSPMRPGAAPGKPTPMPKKPGPMPMEPGVSPGKPAPTRQKVEETPQTPEIESRKDGAAPAPAEAPVASTGEPSEGDPAPARVSVAATDSEPPPARAGGAAGSEAPPARAGAISGSEPPPARASAASDGEASPARASATAGSEALPARASAASDGEAPRARAGAAPEGPAPPAAKAAPSPD